jgi:hypothetical protein
MPRYLKKWLAVYDDEIALFGWTALLLFLLSGSSIILGNFAETAFLKRFGIKYLPVIYMLNAAITFVIMGLLAGVMARLPGIRLLTYVLVFCGGSVAALRFVIPFEFKLLYPLLYIMKAQYIILLGLLFWNLANDLFNTRQAKRLFPLITAGGVVGSIIGSVGTPPLAALISMDNLMLAYAVLVLLAALTAGKMGTHFPALLISDSKAEKTGSRPSIMKQFQDVIPLMQGSALVGVLILLTLLPNLLIPVLNYQFNFAVNSQFATETGMVRFFGYFRGFMSAISLVLLFFVSKAYDRWGLPVALMFHPFNYLLVFVAFLLRFDVFAAMYARLSTNVIRTTLNKPVTDILMGIFPVSYRAALRPFLRGTVVRVGLFTGAGIILVGDKLFHPKYLSLVMLPVVVVWIITVVYLKRNYARILAGLLSKNMVDLKSMELNAVKDLFSDKHARQDLMENFLSMRGEDALWYARLLQSLAVQELDTGILSVLPDQDDKTRIGLLKLLSDHSGDAAIRVLAKIVRTENRALATAVVETALHINTDSAADLCKAVYGTTPYPEVKALAAAGFLGSTSGEYLALIDAWLDSPESDLRLAGVVGAGESGAHAYSSPLKEIVASGQESGLLPNALKSLHRLAAGPINEMAAPHLTSPDESIRRAALEALEVDGDQALKQAITLLGDPADSIRKSAIDKIESAPYQNGRRLVEALNATDKKTRDGIFTLLATLEIKDLDTFAYAKNQIETCYRYLSQADALRHSQKDPYTNLLADHLDEQGRARIETLLRVVALQDRSGRMRTVFRSLFSTDSRQQANAREALDDIADPALLKIFTPLVDNSSTARLIDIGRKRFKFPDFHANLDALYSDLLSQENWVTLILALRVAGGGTTAYTDPETMTKITTSENNLIRRMDSQHLKTQQESSGQKETGMEQEMSIPDKILRLKKIDIFKNMAVNELAAIASISKKVVYPPGHIIFKEGDTADSMYMVITGELTALKNETENIGVLRSGDSFGGMVLLTEDVRLFTARTEQESRLLVIHKHDFIEIVREYPRITLEISKLLAEIVKDLLKKVTDRSGTDGNSIFDGPAGIDRPGQ